MEDEPPWLTDDEQRAWRAFASVLSVLPATLDAQLQRDAGMPTFAYWVLAMLSEAPGHRLRMSDLAARSNGSLSRLSHLAGRLESQGLLRREPAPDDRRGSMAVLTDDGLAAVRAAAPGHVRAVRSLVFDPLSPAQVAQLEQLAATILARTAGEPVAEPDCTA